MFDDAADEYASLSLWNSREETEATAAALRPWLLEITAGQLLGSPESHVFELYELRSR